ncbi:hypothetical protein KL86DES1_21820 [uncultured Desulfovibrio sp.]|uniref:Uncharacterized protein n=1 Tax=uncultured Desulfovibrio sp. TaxID=167968 RepID=A0A212L9I6_9BACT|nr:hypothetical protein KL86DES1_21820 [uncultured Desulfovibrio sp.]
MRMMALRAEASNCSLPECCTIVICCTLPLLSTATTSRHWSQTGCADVKPQLARTFSGICSQGVLDLSWEGAFSEAFAAPAGIGGADAAPVHEVSSNARQSEQSIRTRTRPVVMRKSGIAASAPLVGMNCWRYLPISSS